MIEASVGFARSHERRSPRPAGSFGGTTNPVTPCSDDLRHARHVRTDHGRAARHAFEQRLSKQFRDERLVTFVRAVHARQHDAHRPAVLTHERIVVEAVQERDRLPTSERGESLLRRGIRHGTDDGERHVAWKPSNEIGHALVRKQTADKERATVARDKRIRRELLRIHSAADDPRSREISMTVNATAVLAQVQVPVKPGVGRDVSGYIPAAAAEIADEHALARQTAPCGRGAAHQHVVLMTVNDVRSPHLPKHIETEGVGALPAHQPGVSHRPHPQRPDLLFAGRLTKRDERRRHAIGHLSGQLQRISLGTANDAAGAERCRNDVDNLHRASASAGLRRRASVGTRDTQGCRRADSIGPSGGDLSAGNITTT